MISNRDRHHHVPPSDVAEAAAKGLELRGRFNRGGTDVGVARARDLKNRRALSDETIKRMASYFARHKVDKRAKNFGDDKDFVFCVNTEMSMGEEQIRAHFLLIPDDASLQVILREMKLGG